VRSRLQPAALAVPDAAPAAASLQALLAQLAGQDHLKRRAPPLDVIQAGVGKEVRLIRTADVVYFESDSALHPGGLPQRRADGEALIRTPLKELLAQIDERLLAGAPLGHRQPAACRRCGARGRRAHAPHLARPGEKLPVSRHFQGLFKGQ
jgi:hypothetical protein